MDSTNRLVVIGSDHGAFDMKAQIMEHLKSKNIDYVDLGTYSAESCDYPDIAEAVCRRVLSEPNATGILMCGSGIGISIAANKVNGIRCALCHDHFTAMMSRKHNDANVLAFGARNNGIEIAKQMVDVFLSTEFEGSRHQNRVNKITALEKASL
eukprot:GILI01016186.1.p1 GENE.GILI01016186.1~~GILI01016186.1.p1  ORF type:complete len:154 (-),score=42.50 GILI01016186.1:156-617(-)